MIKYGTVIIYKCVHCEHKIEIPLHQRDMPRLEKYASYCTHDWEEQKQEEDYASTNEDKSGSLQLI